MRLQPKPFGISRNTNNSGIHSEKLKIIFLFYIIIYIYFYFILHFFKNYISVPICFICKQNVSAIIEYNIKNITT